MADTQDDTVSRIDPRPCRPVGEPIPVDKEPISLAAGEGAIWVATMVGDAVVRIDPESGEVVGKPIRVGDRPLAVAAGEGSVWVFNSARGHGQPHRPEDGKVALRRRRRLVERAAGTPDYAGLVVADGSVWVVEPERGHGRAPGRRVEQAADKPIRVGAGPDRPRRRRRRSLGRQLRRRHGDRIDARDGQVGGEPIAVGGQPMAVAVGADGAVWVADAAGAVTRIDPESNAAVGEPIKVGAQAAGRGRRRRRGLGREPVRRHGRADRDLSYDGEVPRRAVPVEDGLGRPPRDGRPSPLGRRGAVAEGRPVRYVRALLLAEDETCFHLYEAATAESVLEATRRAGIPVERVVEAVEFAPARARRPARRSPGARAAGP